MIKMIKIMTDDPTTRNQAPKQMPGSLFQTHPIKPQPLPSIVVPIWSPHNRVYVIFSRLLIQQEHARMMIKLHHDNRTLYPIVECITVFETSNPAEIGFFPMTLDLLHSCFVWLLR